MRFPQPLTRATLLRRYKRFLADVVLEDGTEATAHVANPGAMLGLAEPGMTVWLSRSPSPTRKLAYSWELVEADGALVGVNTHMANRLVAEALTANAIPELSGYADIRPEVKYGEASRIDFLLTAEDRPPAGWRSNPSLSRGRPASLNGPTARQPAPPATSSNSRRVSRTATGRSSSSSSSAATAIASPWPRTSTRRLRKR